MPAAVEESNAPSTSSAPNDKENEEKQEENEEKSEEDKQSWLKAYILRDRARKRQEREAEVEEERLRRERKAQEQQDAMTLGQYREQIQELENKLGMYKEEKHQLFLQLKKVLNEDDHRRRQLQKDSSKQQMVQIQALQQQAMVPNQPQTLYIQQPDRIITHSAQQGLSVCHLPPGAYKPAVKRTRSPSPPPQVPVTMYHQGYTTYKPPSVPGASYQGSPQKDDGRRNELVRAVLWNKPPQYSQQPSAFYPVAPQDISIYYPQIPRDAGGRPVYEQQRPQGFQIDHKLQEHYGGLRAAPPPGHVIHGGPGLVVNPNQAPPPKGGSITAGYPVRSQPQYQQAAPASMYTTQARQIYQNYPPRD